MDNEQLRQLADANGSQGGVLVKELVERSMATLERLNDLQEAVEALSNRVQALEEASGGGSSLTVGRVDVTGLAQQTKTYQLTTNKELYVLQNMLINGGFPSIEGESNPDVLIVKIDVVYKPLDSSLVFGDGNVREVHLVKNKDGKYVGLLVPTSSGSTGADKYIQVLCVGVTAGSKLTDVLFKPLSGYTQ